MTAIRILASLLSAGLLGLASYWSLRLGYADRLAHADSPEAVKRAVELAPANASYRARWAALLDQSGNRAASLSALESAVALNPRDSANWIELGLRAEMDHDFKKAERCLLEGARVDRQYDPRWTLASFYFRRSDKKSFWFWAREAAAMSYGDAAPLFRLCWRATQDPEVILRRAVSDQAAVMVRYLRFLLADNHLEAIEPVAQKVVEGAGRADLPVLLASCDRLLEGREFPAAIRIWTALCQRGLVPYPAPQPNRGLSLTNGDFRFSPLSHGFDWRVNLPEGVSLYRSESPPVLRVSFSGKQPENCEILSQLVPLAPSRKYRLGFRYRTSGIGPNTGLRWRIFDAATGAELTSNCPSLSSKQEVQEDLFFSTHASASLARVALMYQRALGATRIEGSIFLRHVSLGFAPP